MGNNRLFWPQEQVDEWVVDEKVIIKDDFMSVVGQDTTYRIEQALHFTADVGDGSDVHKLVGRVKELSTIEQMGGEHYMDSVILGDSAYQVVVGFSGIPSGVRPGDISGAITQQTGEDDEASDKEMLAKFLLENL